MCALSKGRHPDDDLNEQVAIRIAEYRSIPRLIVFRICQPFSLRVPYAIQDQAEDAEIAIREACTRTARILREPRAGELL